MPIYKMKGKKDGKQKYRVRINYIDGEGKPRQTEKVVYGLEEAKDIEFKMLEEIKKKPIERNLTFKQLLQEYLDVKRYEVRESSFEKIEKAFEHHILPQLENMTLDKLTPQVLQKWKLSIEKKKLGLKAKQDIYAKFRAFLNYEVKMGNLPSNPLTRIGNFKDPNVVKKKKINYYTADEFKQFIAQALKYAEESNTLMAWDFYVFFNIAFYTGMRKGEIYALKWTDIDENNILHVERSITQKLKGEDRETLPKNQASIRSLQLPIPLINILNQHKERYAKIDGFSENWRICGGIKPVRDSSIQNANSRFAKSAGIKTIRIHDFRHSHASLLANEGINIQEIARRLGHSQIEMTWNTYAPFTPERKKER